MLGKKEKKDFKDDNYTGKFAFKKAQITRNKFLNWKKTHQIFFSYMELEQKK